MRLIERTLKMITVHARTDITGAMGSRTRGWAENGTAARASILPRGGDVQGTARGDIARDVLRVIVPAGTSVSAGDGVKIEGRMYAVRAVNRWTAHLELECEAVSCSG